MTGRPATTPATRPLTSNSMNPSNTLAAACGLGLILLAPAQAAILNGSFEVPVIPTNDKSNTTPDHWVGNSAVYTINGIISGFPVAQEGIQYAAIGNNGSQVGQISQTFSTSFADVYSIKWYDSTGYDGVSGNSPYSMSLLTSGGDVVITQNFDALTTPNGSWTGRALDVNLGIGDYTLVFTTLQAPHGNSTMLDNVSLTSAVPEPSTTTVIFALAAGGFFMLRRRLHKS